MAKKPLINNWSATMAGNQDTVDNTETGTQVIGNQVGESTATVSEPKEPEQPVVKEDPEKAALQAELNKIKQRANQLENEKQAQERKQLEEQNKFQELYEQERAKNEERETYELRDSFVDQYPNETVRKAAKALIAKNKTSLLWSNASTEEEAQAQITSYLDALAETLGQPATPEEPQPTVNANNPLPRTETTEEPTGLEARIKRMKETEAKLANYTF